MPLKLKNKLIELLVKQHALFQLPQREILVLHCDPFQFRSFIISFKQTKTKRTTRHKGYTN